MSLFIRFVRVIPLYRCTLNRTSTRAIDIFLRCLTFVIYQWLVPIVPLFIAHESIVAQYKRINKGYITQALRKFSNEILGRKSVAR